MPLCGTERVIVKDLETVRREVAIEDREGNEATYVEDEWHIHVRTCKADEHRCPCCGAKSPVHQTSKEERSWRTVDVGTARCHARAVVSRVVCPGGCNDGRPQTEAVTWADPGARLTRAMDEQIAWGMCHLTRSAVRELLRVGGPAVASACRRVMAREVDQDGLLDGVTSIGIDETGWGKHKVMTVVVDHGRNRVIWAGEGVGKEALRPFFELMGEERCAAVELVSRDGASWIDAAVREHMPGATQVMDPFHVVKWASDALDEVRRQEPGQAHAELAKLPKGKRGRPAKDDENARARALAAARVKEVEGTRWPLQKDPRDLTDKQRETLSAIARANRRLYRAYNLKEGIRDVFDVGAREGCAEELLDCWLSRACRSKIKEFVKMSRAVRKRKADILAAVEHGLSNSRLEATNNKIFGPASDYPQPRSPAPGDRRQTPWRGRGAVDNASGHLSPQRRALRSSSLSQLAFSGSPTRATALIASRICFIDGVA